MTQTGGPAAINGFLYQIIQHLGWLADVTLSGTLDGEAVQEALLVLEPMSGGDARAETANNYLVEQYKCRTDRTWSLRDIEEVLTDLRKSVPVRLPLKATYRFVTDGRAGRLTSFEEFLNDVKTVASADALDTKILHKFRTGLTTSYRQYFDHLVKSTRSKGVKSSPLENEEVLHLLSRFEIEFGASASVRTTEIEQLLRPFVSDLGTESRTREHLVGLLVELLSKGEARLGREELDAIFRKANVSPQRLQRLSSLNSTLTDLTFQRLAQLNYHHELDVRTSPHWPPDKSVLILTGESGSGKTWHLGRFLFEHLKAGQIATLSTMSIDAETVMSRASRDVWQTGLGETTEKSLPALSSFLQELDPSSPSPLLTVAVDGVQDIDVARDLVRQNWNNWKMRLVMTTPVSVARSLELSDQNSIHVSPIGDFLIEEADELLRRHKQRWSDLPDDLKKLVCKPVLAGLYLELDHSSFEKAPQSEYEIFEKYWDRISLRGQHGDEGVLIALAAHMRKALPYPLPRSAWSKIGLFEDGPRIRLEAAGWLQSNEFGDLAFAHQRLLNFALAKHYLRLLRRREITVDALAEFLVGSESEKEHRLVQQLGYVTMDTIWMLSDVHEESALVAKLIRLLEDSQAFGSYGQELYTSLLPTLGQRSVAILLSRLLEITNESDDEYKIGLISKSFAILAKQEQVDLASTISSLLFSPLRGRQAVAINILTVAPNTNYLARLWDLHRIRSDALADHSLTSRHGDYKESMEAMRACVNIDPEWLHNRIMEADPHEEPVSELAFLLRGLKHPSASDVWRSTRTILVEKVPRTKARSVLSCIGRFLDKTLLSFVIEHLNTPDDFASGVAFETLSILDAKEAIYRLVDLDNSERYITRNRWLPILLDTQPALTRKFILEVAEREPNSRQLVEKLFWERPNKIDVPILDYILRNLEIELAKTHDTSEWLFHPLDFLSRITQPELLGVMESEAGTNFESLLTATLCERLNKNSNTMDHVLESGRRVLILICGSGITTLLRSELRSEHYWVRHSGLNHAYIRADDDIINLLTIIAEQHTPSDDNSEGDSSSQLEFHLTLSALGVLGADEAIVRIVSKFGASVPFPAELANLRKVAGAMPEHIFKPALEILQNPHAQESQLLPAIITAWLSSNKSFIPLLHNTLSLAEPESLVARLACIALVQLGDKSSEFARLVLPVAESKENATYGINALIQMEKSEFLSQWLNNRGASVNSEHDYAITRSLYADPSTRPQAIEMAADSTNSISINQNYAIAGESSNPDVRQRILDKAFSARSFSSAHTLSAIEGISKFDTPRAIEAIEIGLQVHSKIERQLCHLLVRLSPETAANRLLKAIATVDRVSLRSAVGRALRSLAPNALAPIIVQTLEPPRATLATIELAGWLAIPEVANALNTLASNESEPGIRMAAINALEQHTRENTTRQLLESFKSANNERKWALIVSVVDLADPYLLTRRNDSCWLGHIFTNDSTIPFEWYARSALERRKRKVD